MALINFRLDCGDRVAGDVALPDDEKGSWPVMIFCHGWGAHRGWNPCCWDLGKMLIQEGIAMVNFDFFGCGDTGGDYGEMTYGRWAENLRDVFHWVCEQKWASPGKVGIFAVSSGSTAALRFAQEAEGIAYLISIGTCLGLFMNMPNGPGRVLAENLDTLVAGGTAQVFNTQFGIQFFKDYLGKAPAYNVGATKCPVYFLQGGQDSMWRRSDAWIGYEIMKKHNLPTKYVEIAEGDHGLSNVNERTFDEIMIWLRELNILEKSDTISA